MNEKKKKMKKGKIKELKLSCQRYHQVEKVREEKQIKYNNFFLFKLSTLWQRSHQSFYTKQFRSMVSCDL